MDLIVDLLSSAEEYIGRSKLLKKTGMSYKLFDMYLSHLIERKLIEERLEEDHKIYVATEQGNFLLDEIKDVIKKIK